MARIHVIVVAHATVGGVSITGARLEFDATVADQTAATTLFDAVKTWVSGAATIDSASAQYIPDQVSL